ncbi:Hypothetical Protein FCC1311_104782 [Hondaea fermentalgiana]|uniref:Uncharacterized protein n=1 Tax=Hondaea fermentalgiana TaxID=2315210 RepID=A0A2R5H1M8_9STRA|nr:Hypothetical Protein FCC1311_104782 [Hondaea fermentalgiana]|eukprot:GBG34254.1 Hypothetical Protein FCC1311_104782 [Hondaea fermentalgiana]
MASEEADAADEEAQKTTKVKPVLDQLREAARSYNPRWTTQRAVEDAIERTALLNAASRKVVKEERKVCKTRAETCELLNASATQVIRGLVQAVQRLDKENETLRNRGQLCERRLHSTRHALAAMAAQLEAHPAHENFSWSDEVLRCDSDITSDEPSEAIAGQEVAEELSSALEDAVAHLQSAIKSCLAVYSSAYNPERQIQDLVSISQGRHEQLQRSNAELVVLDERVRELRKQVALGIEQRSKALEEATSKAYTRSFQQHHAELHRLQVDRDALVVELARKTQQVALLDPKRAPPKRIAPLNLAPAC